MISVAFGLPSTLSGFFYPAFCSDRQLISCSEDGSVRIWEVREKQQLAAEPVPTGACRPPQNMLFPLPPSFLSPPLLPSFFISSSRTMRGDNEVPEEPQRMCPV